MYSLYLDASGTHGASPVYILAGVAVHEQDAYHLQQRFAAPLAKLPGGPDPRDYELHATEMKSPRKPTSIWQGVPDTVRFEILRASFRALKSFKPTNADQPCVYFGAVVERSFSDCEERAWHEVLHCFDEMLTCQAKEQGEHQRGIVIHDRSATERRVQNWTDRWRLIESRIGVLTHLVDVPFFADSQASRLLQAADLSPGRCGATTACRLPMSVGSNLCGRTSTRLTARCTAWSTSPVASKWGSVRVRHAPAAPSSDGASGRAALSCADPKYLAHPSSYKR